MFKKESMVILIMLNTILPLIIGISASYIVVRHLIKLKPAIKIYPFIVKPMGDTYYVVLLNKELEVFDLKIYALLYHKSKDQNVVNTIQIPLWNKGQYPILVNPQVGFSIKLDRKFFEEIVTQQGSYNFVEKGLIDRIKLLLCEPELKDKYDDFTPTLKQRAKQLFSELVKAYGAVQVVINLEHKSTGLRKTKSKLVKELQEIENWDVVTNKKYKDIP